MPSRDDRRFGGHRRDQRGHGARDRDRILYSSAFRRLAGVSQVAAASEGHLFHDRLIHSLKVGQIARRLAEKFIDEQGDIVSAIGGIDPEVTEAAAFAHDLGHPPFGHVAEESLDDLIRDHGCVEGFEGNAQSFRIVNSLTLRDEDPAVAGLNLTRATLNAILKYPWYRGQDGKKWRKFGAYATEQPAFEHARALGPAEDRRSAEAEIMDWADDITYAIHDIEDFYRAGLIPLDLLRVEGEEQGAFLQWARERWAKQERLEARTDARWQGIRKAFTNFLGTFSAIGPYVGSRIQRANVRRFTATGINNLVQATTLDTRGPDSTGFLAIDRRKREVVDLLKELVWRYVIERPSLASQQAGQQRMVAVVFQAFWDAVHGGREALLPLRFQEELDLAKARVSPRVPIEYESARIVADAVVSLAEAELVRTYGRITGISLGSILDPTY